MVYHEYLSPSSWPASLRPDAEMDRIREFSSSQEILFLKRQNEELMRLLGIILEDEENLEKFPVLKEAYKEYLFIRTLILGPTTLE